MALDIVYGYQGKDHVKASQLARLLSGTIGGGRYVLGTQNEMSASMQTANKVRIATGDLVMDGRYITNEAYQDLTVDSGQSGYKRNDLVGVEYSRASGSDADHAVETVSLVVKKGTQTTGTATDPSYTAGDIAAGDASAFYPLWRLPINGLTVGTPVQLFEKAPSVADLRETISQPNRVYGTEMSSLSAYKVGCVAFVVLSSYRATVKAFTENIIATLPSSVKPVREVSCSVRSSLAESGGALVVKTNGQVALSAGGVDLNNAFYNATISYPVAN